MKVSALRTLREAAGLTRDQLAEQAAISKRSIAAYELGEAQPTLSLAIRLADALRVSLDELAGRNHLADVTPAALASDGSTSPTKSRGPARTPEENGAEPQTGEGYP